MKQKESHFNYKGPTLLPFHSISAHISHWQRCAEVNDRDWRVICPSEGHAGGSDLPPARVAFFPHQLRIAGGEDSHQDGHSNDLVVPAGVWD